MAAPGVNIVFLGVDSSLVDVTEKKSSRGNNKTQYFTAAEMVGASNEFSEILANGNETGTNDITISAAGGNRKIVTDNSTSNNSIMLSFLNSVNMDQLVIAKQGLDLGGTLTIAEANAAISYLESGGASFNEFRVNNTGFLFDRTGTGQKDLTLSEKIDFKIQSKDAANFYGEFTSGNITADRTYTFQDADGTVAFLSDITANNELSEILANGNTTGANDIVVSTQGANRIIRSDNSTASDRMAIQFTDGGVNQDTIQIGDTAASLGGWLGLYEGSASFAVFTAGLTAAHFDIDAGAAEFLFTSQSGQFDVVFDNSVDVKIQSPDGANRFADFTPVNLSVDRTYTFQDASGTVAFLSDVTAGDTNFATSNLTFTASRTHELGGNDFVIQEGSAQTFSMFNGFATQLTYGNTIMEMATAYQTFVVDNVARLDLVANETVVNQGGADLDFRVESDTIPNAFFIQGSDGYIGVGVVPSYKFDIEGTGLIESHVKSSSNAANLRVNAATNFDAGVYLMENDVDKWRVYNDGSTGDDLAIYNYTAAGFSMHIDGTNNWTCIGGTAAQTMLDVRGGGKFSDNLELIPPGSTASDIALTIRNSGDSADMLTVTGQGALRQVIATAPTVDITDSSHMYVADVVAGTAAHTFRNESGDIIKMYQETALTTAETTITFVDENTPDFALSSLTTTSAAGFATLDEAQGFVEAVANMQTRVNELETKLQNIGWLA